MTALATSTALLDEPVPSVRTEGAWPAEHRIVLTGRTVPADAVRTVRRLLGPVGTSAAPPRTLAGHPCTVLEIPVRLARPTGVVETVLRTGLHRLARRYELDAALLPSDGGHRVIAFDVDNTLARGEAIDRLAARAGRMAEVADVTRRAMEGRIGFAESLRMRVRALAGLPASVLDEVADETRLTPGARVAVRTLQSAGIRVGALSGGFGPIVGRIAADLGLDFHAANELEIRDGVLTGALDGPILDGPGKAAELQRVAFRAGVTLDACVAVGDGANDVPMIRAAGLGIAFTGTPPVCAAADVAISFPRLDLVLPLLGLPVPCAVVG